jgi:hypothetical protein
MNEYKGAVAFLDLLGIGQLTRGKITLIQQDFEAFDLPSASVDQVHRFAANILVLFRKALLRARAQHKDVKFAQLSDSAFLWSSKPLDVVNAARAVMWDVTTTGLLCRGGLSFGGIIEPDKVNHGIGAFVLGEAATTAVDVEHSGKGCRLFSDVALPTTLSIDKSTWQTVNWGTKAWYSPFASVENPLDGSLVDEFRWYFYRDPLGEEAQSDCPDEQRLLGVTELLANLRCSPRFRWNTASPDGLRQIGVSIAALAQCTHQFDGTIDFAVPAETFINHPTIHRSPDIVETEILIRKTAIAEYFRRQRKLSRQP